MMDNEKPKRIENDNPYLYSANQTLPIGKSCMEDSHEKLYHLIKIQQKPSENGQVESSWVFPGIAWFYIFSGSSCTRFPEVYRFPEISWGFWVHLSWVPKSLKPMLVLWSEFWEREAWQVAKWISTVTENPQTVRFVQGINQHGELPCDRDQHRSTTARLLRWYSCAPHSATESISTSERANQTVKELTAANLFFVESQIHPQFMAGKNWQGKQGALGGLEC